MFSVYVNVHCSHSHTLCDLSFD
uniref:Uncharacterized protein n=1 Tax=Arundo donax TaxID=35708 RepID=A0A0A8ZI01_ARUDO